VKHLPPEVRLLPSTLRDVRVSSVQEYQSDFLRRRLPHQQNGRYWYRERGLSAARGTMVLFQCEAQIVGIARFIEQVPVENSKNEYRGYLQFEPRSIRAIGPFSEQEMLVAWPGFGGFSHARLHLDPTKFNDFLGKLVQRPPSSLAEEVWESAVRSVTIYKKTVFTRQDLRKSAGVEQDRWSASYSPIFQGMRIDQPGGAPLVPAQYRNVFQQIRHGYYQLTEDGRALLNKSRNGNGMVPGVIEHIETQLENEKYFDPGNTYDERTRCLREVVQRWGQPDFRERLLSAYNEQCPITGCNATPALEAAHILPYAGKKSQHTTNGLLLRSDIHSLFDLNLFGIEPTTLKVVLARELTETSYSKYDGVQLTVPKARADWPSHDALCLRWAIFREQNNL